MENTIPLTSDTFPGNDFSTLLIRYGLNLFFTILLVRFIYYPLYRQKTYLFIFFLFNTVVFFVCALLSNTNLSMAFAFGVFAVFSILRYRTETIPIKEMTYLFIAITLGVLNAASLSSMSNAVPLIANSIIVIMTFVLERVWLKKKIRYKNILYEKIENIIPEKQEILKTDLKERTGLEISDVEILEIDFLKDTVKVRITYIEK